MAPSLCTRCKKRLPAQCIRAAGMQFHVGCFTCDTCKKPLEKSFQHKQGRLYHSDCYQRLFGLKCHHCHQYIEGPYVKTDTGMPYHKACYQDVHQLVCALCEQSIEGPYLQDPWGRKTHPQHGSAVTLSCHVCARLVQQGQAKTLADQRQVCSICQATEVIHPTQVQAAKKEALAHLNGVGFAYIPDYVKIEMYSEQKLINERMRASATGNIHGYTRTAQRHIPQYGLILEHSIHILNGMPRLAFMGVLAHELLHVWIHENNLKHLQPMQVEGFCNLATALIYQQAATPADQELATVLLKRLQEDPDPTYGDGYRLMVKHLDTLGWPGLLAAMTRPGGLEQVDATDLTTPPSAQLSSTQPKQRSRQQQSQSATHAVESPKIPTASPAKRTAGSAEDSAQRLAEIKARVKAQMDQVRAQSAVAPQAKQTKSPSRKGLKKLGKKKRS